MITILKQTTVENKTGVRETYVTVRFSETHDIFDDTQIVRTFLVPKNKTQDELLQEEYQIWFSSLDDSEF